ncbi:RNA polymerase sigma-70 factor [Pedobacter sp. MC2016-05]|uniref:RNA polymerase sigma factor n=1 Tax=Pedobacter sp. MC2016-05 TaxID=2994474 RepID=UPI002247B2C1|nr:RNA polymerase sigma-70 factor [Pedobacter sp. MC2016-05]MCX2475368.1 RNA polymerase sigma-70 factor [Pedobacter sp. MC2016-05]
MYPQTERVILSALRAGDTGAFEVLYQNYSKIILRKLVKMVKNIPLAEELTQDVFVKVWDKRAIIDTEKPFSFYILTIANNLVSDFYRKAARDQRLLNAIVSSSAELYNPVEDTLFYRESEALLNQAIQRLPPQQKQVFILCKLEGNSYEEVATKLGISTSTVSNHIVKATKAVKKAFFKSETGFLILALSLMSGRL